MRTQYTKTAEQLSEIIPWIAFLVVGEYVNVMFPGTSPARYARVVKVVGRRPWPSVVPKDLTLYFDGNQWNNVVVPLVQDVQTTGWRGEIPYLPGESVKLLQTIYGPGGSVVASEGEELGSLAGSEEPQPGILYGATEYVQELKLRTLKLALALGY